MTRTKYESILGRLLKTRNSISGWLAFEGIIETLALAAGLIFVLWLATALFWPEPVARVTMLVIGLALSTTVIGVYIVKPLIRKRSLTSVALKLEKHYGKLQSRLIGSLQLYDKLSDNKENYSVELIEKTIEDAGEQIRDLDFNVAVEKHKPPYYRLALGVLLVIMSVFISGETMYQTSMLFTHPLADIPRPTNLVLTVSPENIQAIKNDDVTIRIGAAGEKVREVNLLVKYSESDWVSIPAVKAESDSLEGLYSYTFRKLKRDVEFYAEAKRVKSPTGKITIVDPPRLLEIAITLDFPKYTGLESQVLPNNDGSVTALRGTVINFTGRLNKPVTTGSLEFNDGRTKPITINEKEISGKFVISDNGSYHLRLADVTGLSNPNPIEYDLVCLNDYEPQVQITFPAVDVDLDERMILPIEAVVFDDYGFTKLDLVYWTYSEGHESDRKIQTIKSDFSALTETVVSYEWWVEQLHLLPGDLVYYYLEVFDNDAITGPKSSVSKTFTARLPSLDEIMADITQSEDEMFEDFEEAVNSQRQLKEELENISREMKQHSEMDWEKKQELQSTLDRQKDISQKIEELGKKMDEMLEKYDRNQMATEELMQKMEDIRELFEEVATDELKEAMKKLQEAMKSMDPKKLEEAMKNFQMSVEQMNENLDRMMALLKKYQLEQKLDTLAKMAQKLAEKQQDINDQLGQCNGKKDFEKMKQPQEKQKQGLESMKEQFEQAKKLNEELSMVPKDQMQQANQKLNSEQMQKSMNQMAQSMGMCNKQQCQKSGQEMEQEFQEMSQMFQNMLQQMQQQQLEMVTGMIKRAINDLIYLSREQEGLIDSTEQMRNKRSNSREIAREQNDLKSACNRAAENIAEVTKETLFINASIMQQMGKALAEMQNAIEQLNGRSPSRSSGNQGEAMSSLNHAAAILMSALSQCSQCKNSGSGMQSMMQKLSQMAQQQQQLNQNSQNMMPMPMPGMMSMAQMQAMQRLAQQQEAIRKELSELMKEAGNADNVLGRLDNIEGEMKKIVEDMQNRNMTQETINRQNRILSRLLDAQRSVHRRDYSRRRQARTGEDVTRRGPGVLNFDDNFSEKMAEDIKKALSEKYPRRYEHEIREYFRALTEDQDVQ